MNDDNGNGRWLKYLVPLITVVCIAAVAIYQGRLNDADIDTKVDKEVYAIQVTELNKDVEELQSDVDDLDKKMDDNTITILSAIKEQQQ